MKVDEAAPLLARRGWSLLHRRTLDFLLDLRTWCSFAAGTEGDDVCGIKARGYSAVALDYGTHVVRHNRFHLLARLLLDRIR